MSKKVFVSPTDNGWKIKSVGAERAAAICNTKSEAVNRAIQISKNQNAELFVQNSNGRIGWKNSYGNDPRNIKG